MCCFVTQRTEGGSLGRVLRYEGVRRLVIEVRWWVNLAQFARIISPYWLVWYEGLQLRDVPFWRTIHVFCVLFVVVVCFRIERLLVLHMMQQVKIYTYTVILLESCQHVFSSRGLSDVSHAKCWQICHPSCIRDPSWQISASESCFKTWDLKRVVMTLIDLLRLLQAKPFL